MSGHPWYVAVRIPSGTRMNIACGRDAAITMARALLRDGEDVQEIGPMIEDPEGNVLKAPDLRRILEDREAA